MSEKRIFVALKAEVIGFGRTDAICTSEEPEKKPYVMTVGNNGVGTALTADLSRLFD